MSLLRTSFLSGIAVAVKVASGLVLNKLLAVYVGPAGYAVIAQFQNAVSIIVSLVGGVLATGVTKATAQHFDSESQQHAIWRTAIRLALVASIMAIIPLILLSSILAKLILHRIDLSNVFVWLALTLPAMTVNNLLLAIVNGKKEVGILVTANIMGSMVGLLVTGLFSYNYGLYGTLVAFVISPALMLLSTTILLIRREWFKVGFLIGKMNKIVLKELGGFALMGLTSALMVPLSNIIIRDHIATKLGMPEAGYWQASSNISGIYLMLVTSTLSVYYLPRIAEIITASELKIEIFKVYKFSMPVVILGAISIYILRNFIIKLIFTSDFLPMQDLFFWQLSGDVMKVGSWILACIMLGRSMVKVFIISEIFFSLLFVLMTWVLVDFYGLVGVSMAYAANYFLYWLVMIYLIRKEMQIMQS